MCCNAIKWVNRTSQVYTLKQKWYATLSFCVWMWRTHTIITWTHLTLVINFGMCTELTTICVFKSGDGIFYFGDTATSLLMHKLFIKRFLKKARWILWSIISFDVWLACQILASQVLVAMIIWFQQFNAKASWRMIDLHRLLMFYNNHKKKRETKRGIGSWTQSSISQLERHHQIRYWKQSA